jgi:hypothetical protein
LEFSNKLASHINEDFLKKNLNFTIPGIDDTSRLSFEVKLIDQYHVQIILLINGSLLKK